MLTLLTLALAALFLISRPPSAQNTARPIASASGISAGAGISGEIAAVIAEPQKYKPLTTLDAVAENAGRPLSGRPLELARPFLLPTSDPAWDKALNCLALANYYEAASEGPAGMRAVSQVVLNRMRHPAFPHSVCEVVFQGADRSTGCQFTFTCDGALNRKPIPALFTQAQAIASEALRGRVEASVGMATHYHANFVVPYWADSLDKVRTVGSHIFYIWRGAAGSRSAFRAVYTGETDASPVPTLVPLTISDGSDAPIASSGLALAAERIRLSANAQGSGTAERTFLVADEGKRSLKADDNENAGTLRVQPLLSRSDGKVLSDAN